MVLLYIANPDASLDLNMMLIQVREVIPSWYLYGEALGVSEEMLKEVNGMKMDDYDKLVEVLDCWFRSFPKNKPPTWRDVALGLQNVGFNKLSADIMKVYTTGKTVTAWCMQYLVNMPLLYLYYMLCHANTWLA